LPGIISALAQTQDGVLWIGTELGLLRFDGVRFVLSSPPFGPPLQRDSIAALMAAGDGSLWISTRTGLVHWKDGKMATIPTAPPVSGAVARAFLESRDHKVWAAFVGSNAGGLCRIDQEKLQCETGILSGTSLLEDRSGKLWMGGLGVLYCRDGNSIRTYKLQSPAMTVSSIAEDAAGQVWLAADGGGLLRFDRDHLVADNAKSPGEPFQPHVLRSDRDGGLWIGTFGQGLIHMHQGRIDRFAKVDGLSSDLVWALFEDHEGNVWAATENGVDRFSEFAVTTFSRREGLSSALVTSVFPSPRGEIWVGTTAGLDRIVDNKVAGHEFASGPASATITGLFEASSGTLWAATSHGLEYRDKAGFQAAVLPPDHAIRSLTSAVETGGDIWFADPQQGLLRFHEGRFAQFVPSSVFNHQAIWAMEPGRHDGEIWLGSGGGSVAHWKRGQVTHWYTNKDGLPNGPVADLHLGRDGTLWIATQNGLSRLSHDQIATLGAANGLPCEHIQAIVEDDSGDLWLNTPCGLIHLAAADLAAWSIDPRRSVHSAVYDALDGMSLHAGSLGYFRHAGKSTDGRLWFVTVDGVSVIDPRRLPINNLAPPVQIEKITADNIDYAVSGQPRLPPRTKTLEIDYTAFSFVAPEKVNFRYRLVEMESDWHQAGPYRRATYTNLPPGQYHFLVQAANNSGVWSNTGASFAFSVIPAFTQTNAFLIICAVGGILLLWAFYLMRVRQVAAKVKMRLEARYAERARIANELHDDLLQNLSGFILQLDGLIKIVSDPARAQNRIRDLREQTEQSLHETREAIWNIRSRSSDQGFQDELQDMVDQIAKGKPVRTVITVTGDRRAVEPALAGQLLRIAREAVGNAIRHSGAKLIRVHVAYGAADTLQISIIDDGCGFDLEQGSRKMKHWGLSSMRERARDIGAEFKIITAPGEGTRIEVSVRSNSQSKLS